jgi:DNA-binding transcriptional LysR family regulator
MRPFTQCVIRDSAQTPAPDSYFIIEGAHRCSVPDQLMKKELILHGLAWGHLPAWLIAEELRDGRLRSLANPHLPGLTVGLAAVRLREAPQGPVAEALWRDLQSGAATPLIP